MKVEKGEPGRAVLDAVSGAVAGGISRTVVSPLDLIKIRFQVQLEPTNNRRGSLPASHVASKYTGILQAAKDIVREEGIKGLWKGNVPALLLVMPYTAIQFVVLQQVKAKAAVYGCEDMPGLHFLSGSIAGAAATFGSYPFDLLRTIMASQGEPKVYPTMRLAFTEILKSRGLPGIYAGLRPTLVEIIPYSGLQFGTYEVLKRWTRALGAKEGCGSDTDTQKPSSLEHFICGFGAGTFAKLCCHPLDVVKKRFQVEGLARDPKYGARIERKAYQGMSDAIRRILQNEGWAGLYKGTMPSVLKAAPASAITFVVYERVLNFGLAFEGVDPS